MTAEVLVEVKVGSLEGRSRGSGSPVGVDAVSWYLRSTQAKGGIIHHCGKYTEQRRQVPKAEIASAMLSKEPPRRLESHRCGEGRMKEDRGWRSELIVKARSMRDRAWVEVTYKVKRRDGSQGRR